MILLNFPVFICVLLGTMAAILEERREKLEISDLQSSLIPRSHQRQMTSAFLQNINTT